MAEINIEKMAQKVAQRAIQELRDNGVFVSRWIPVSERLPEECSGVLVYCPANYNIFLAYLEQGKWYIFSPDGNESLNEPIVAWMPLPEPYKAESENTDGNS